MITRKKVLSLGLLFSLIGTSMVQAYKATLYNDTPYLVEFKIKYVVGSKNKIVLPGEKKTISGPTLAAIVQRVKVDVYEDLAPSIRQQFTTRGFREEFNRIVARPYDPPAGRAGDSAFVVFGDKNSGYEVHRYIKN